ncbi:hypothetical protein CO652_21120 [Rhizobium sp. H4]|nr:hypothetical protein CO652_21120 [Rhizobium sp. H4]
MIIFIEAMHLLPHPFDMQAPILLPRSPAGTAALLLPAVVRFFSKSLPHLLPRQAFSFWPPDRAESGRLRWGCRRQSQAISPVCSQLSRMLLPPPFPRARRRQSC